MPWGWECRQKLLKQNPWKPTERRKEIEIKQPGPNEYNTPSLYCGPGYSHIKKMPCYTMRYKLKPIVKIASKPNAPIFNVCGIGSKGPFRIPGSVISPQIEPLASRTKVPGPGTYAPKYQFPQPPAYTMRPAARPKYVPWDQWNPPPNMYWPPIPAKKTAAYTIGYAAKPAKIQNIPGPGNYDSNYDFSKKREPAYSFGYPARPTKLPVIPPPNTYCEKKFCISKPRAPERTFGIRHSPYLGKFEPNMKPSNLELQIRKINY